MHYPYTLLFFPCMYVHTTALSLLAPPFFLIILGTFSSPFTFLFDAERRTRVLVVLPSASYCPPLLSHSLSRSAPPTDDGLLLRVPLSQLLPLRRTEDGGGGGGRRRGEMLLAPERRGKREGEKGAFPRLSSGLSGKGGELPFHYIPSTPSPSPRRRSRFLSSYTGCCHCLSGLSLFFQLLFDLATAAAAVAPPPLLPSHGPTSGPSSSVGSFRGNL